jgi:Spy/CpxP family protein refolding chaperone
MLLHRKMIVASVAAAAVLAIAAASQAQTAPKAPPPAAPAVKSPPQGQPGAGPVARLNLTQAQRDQIRTLREAQRTDSLALREKMRAARQQLHQAMRADVPDEAAVRSAAGAVAALRADQAALQARSRAQSMKALTPEQQAQLKQARARAAARAQRAHRAMRAQRPMMGRGPMMRPMWREQQLRRQLAWRWRGWI